MALIERTQSANDYAKRLGLAKEITRLPDGLETQIGHTSAPLLSMGNIKMLNIVTQLASDKPLIMLERPDASLDLDTLGSLVTVLEEEVSAGRTILMVSYHEKLRELASRTITIEGVSQQGATRMNRLDASNCSETSAQRDALNHLERESLSILRQLEVNANIQLFAHQWVDENGIESLDEMFAMFDRLALPYRLVANLDEVGEHKLVLLVLGENELLSGHVESKQFISSDANDDISVVPQFCIVIEGAPLEKPSPDWVGNRLHAFRPIIPKLLLVSFITNLFALAVPFITMSIYDHVIGGDAGHELQGIAIGAALLFVMMGWLRTLRSRVFASVSNRVSREISQSLVQRLLRNSYAQNQQTASSSQQNQVMLSERISGVLSGPLGNALFDLPFIVIFVLAIGVLGGWLVLVPIVSLILYYLLAKRSIRSSSKRSMQSTVAGTNRQNMINELSSKLAFIRSAGLSEHWIQRFKKYQSSGFYGGIQSIGPSESIYLYLLFHWCGFDISCDGVRHWAYI